MSPPVEEHPPLPARALLHPDRTALVEAGGAWHYRELFEASARIASRLLGGRADLDEARVALLVAPGAGFAAALWGIWRAGGLAVPLALSHPEPELEYVVADAEATALITDPAALSRAETVARATGARLLPLGGGVEASPGPLPPIDPRRRALMVYTSGTTGRPKGVVTTHANLVAQVTCLVQAWEWTSADRTLLVLPLHHVHGLINVLGCALWSGATCEVLPRFDAGATWSRLASGELTVFMAVPTIYHRLIAAWETASAELRHAWSTGARGLRLMVSGSAALPGETLERWRAITGHTLLERYGMTEIGMALSNPLRGERRPGHVGGPLPGVAVRLVGEAGTEIPAGTPGEIEVRGPGVFLEYWRRPEATRAAFRDGWFRTGDIGVDDGGSIRILGRASVDIIKTGGYKVSALDIEEVLREHPDIADCAVVGVPDTEYGERLCVAVVAGPGGAPSLDALQSWARARLAPYKVPRDLVAVPELPRNAMGKVVKPQVARLFAPPDAAPADSHG